MKDARRSLPGVGALLERADIAALAAQHPRSLVVEAVRRAIDAVRASGAVESVDDWPVRVIAQLRGLSRRSLIPVFNATGVILHTNLGRAPLAQAAIDAVREAAEGFTNLEYDLEAGGRGSRYVHCAGLVRELTGAEDALVVNNCASALVLTLSALARGREVVVSRGELVEIGGSFRVPDIMQRSGAELVEVGTTNRTHPEDYRRAIGPRTGAIAKIHRSNFSLTGFVAEVGVETLRPIAAEHGLPVVHDLGSGLLIPLDEYGLSGEPTARAAIEAGATVVLMSGDKLLGGPQAGIIAGSREALARIRKDPFARAMRVDRMTIAALTATLELYREPARALREIPALAMLTAPREDIAARAEQIADRLRAARIQCDIVASSASVGGGAFPQAKIPSHAIVPEGNAVSLERVFRTADRPAIGRIEDDRLLLDIRSIPARDDEAFADALIAALA